jgi:hypothetical protein
MSLGKVALIYNFVGNLNLHFMIMLSRRSFVLQERIIVVKTKSSTLRAKSRESKRGDTPRQTITGQIP